MDDRLRRAAAPLGPRAYLLLRRPQPTPKDYENLADTLLAFVTLASIQIALRRLARG
jgi:hypothetical protein